jgi:hypothetical protein
VTFSPHSGRQGIDPTHRRLLVVEEMKLSPSHILRRGNRRISTIRFERILNAAARTVASRAERLQAFATHLEQRRLKHRNAVNPNALLVWIPKTAGTSLNTLLTDAGGQALFTISDARRYFRNRGIVTFGHIGIPQLRAAGVLQDHFYNSALKFAFVRNPFDRAVSLYEYSRAIAKIPPTMSFSIFCRMLKERAYEDVGDYNHVGLSQLNPQLKWLAGSNGELCIDFLGRFESLDQDISRLMRQLNLPVTPAPIPRANTSSRQPIESYYGDAEVEAIQTAYRCDFDAFGYSAIPRWELDRVSRAA